MRPTALRTFSGDRWRAGAASRCARGNVIVTGLSIGTLFALFVVPSVYMLMARDRANVPAPTGAATLQPAHA